MIPYLVNKTVEYNGSNRPFLIGLRGVVASQAMGSKTCRVVFTQKDGSTLDEYVGVDYLNVVDPDLSEAQQILKKKLSGIEATLKDLEAEKELLDARVETMRLRAKAFRESIELLNSDRL